MPIPYISTRGYYDLSSGKTLKKKNYHFTTKDFEKLRGKNEVAIMIHGLRNDRKGARQKFVLAKNRLQKIGYRHPVIGFSYDSNTKGAHLKKCVRKSLRVGQLIAKKNGYNLGTFILDLKKKYPSIRIRLLGHSLGSEVILATINYLGKKSKTDYIIESVYFFGSSIQRKSLLQSSAKSLKKVLRKNIVNYYAPSDEVLKESTRDGLLANPIGLVGMSNCLQKYTQKKVTPKNHRFASYVLTIKNFP